MLSKNSLVVICVTSYMFFAPLYFYIKNERSEAFRSWYMYRVDKPNNWLVLVQPELETIDDQEGFKNLTYLKNQVFRVRNEVAARNKIGTLCNDYGLAAHDVKLYLARPSSTGWQWLARAGALDCNLYGRNLGTL